MQASFSTRDRSEMQAAMGTYKFNLNFLGCSFLPDRYWHIQSVLPMLRAPVGEQDRSPHGSVRPCERCVVSVTWCPRCADFDTKFVHCDGISCHSIMKNLFTIPFPFAMAFFNSDDLNVAGQTRNLTAQIANIKQKRANGVSLQHSSLFCCHKRFIKLL